MLTEFAPAKINLTLHVVGRRPDGYHLLDSLVVFAGAGDRLHAEDAPALSLTLGGPFAAGLAADADNLVLRAARALAKALDRPAAARLHLEKHLPVASGIGGGSADAAAALRLLCRLWGEHPHAGLLQQIATELGADVPVCLACEPRRMTGVGETLSPAPGLPECGILLVNPGLALATQAVFHARAAPFSVAPSWPETWPESWPDAASMAAALATGANDLEPPAIALCPAIAAVLRCLAGLPGSLLVRMSGSGASCFALFATADAARDAAAELDDTGWWRWGGPLYARGAAT